MGSNATVILNGKSIIPLDPYFSPPNSEQESTTKSGCGSEADMLALLEEGFVPENAFSGDNYYRDITLIDSLTDDELKEISYTAEEENQDWYTTEYREFCEAVVKKIADRLKPVEFKVGDKVRCVNLDDEWAVSEGLVIGNVYSVVKDKSEDIRVNGDRGFWVSTKCFELVKR